MEFKPIALADRKALLPLLQSLPIPICEYAFTNLYGWAVNFSTQWEIFGVQTLVIRFFSPRFDHAVYMLPRCHNEASWRTTMQTLKERAEKDNVPLIFFGVTSNCASELDAAFPGEYQFIWEEASIDYIYTREKLASLTGKKLQPKRNHINKFDRLYPNYSYVPLLPERVEEYIAFADRWLQDEQHSGESLKAENEMIHSILNAFEELELMGGTLVVDDDIVALTIASKINDETIDVHVEKALISYEGAYSKINNSFVKSLPESIRYINREEDLGLPGLRKAKESYQPDLRLAKGIALLKRIC